MGVGDDIPVDPGGFGKGGKAGSVQVVCSGLGGELTADYHLPRALCREIMAATEEVAVGPPLGLDERFIRCVDCVRDRNSVFGLREGQHFGCQGASVTATGTKVVGMEDMGIGWFRCHAVQSSHKESEAVGSIVEWHQGACQQVDWALFGVFTHSPDLNERGFPD